MVHDKFILMGLDDENSKDVAGVLGNKTCKKILDFLADVKEASEKDISDELSMPINTVEYNLKKLVSSGLVEKTKNFFWSVKGKKIPMYKLARKHIIISNKKPNLNYLKSILPVILIAGIFLVLAGLVVFPDVDDLGDGLGGEQSLLKQFGSLSELESFLEENVGSGGGEKYTAWALDGSPRSFTTGISPAITSVQAGEVAEDSQSNGGGGGTSDYSETNIQVEGVDEADIVKNDGKYIYVASGNKVVIVEAYPAEEMNVLSEIEFEGRVSEIFVNEDKLIVFSESYGSGTGIMAESMCVGKGCGGYSDYVSTVYVYDISDRENPELENDIGNDGNYVDSRMIGNYVYVISTKYVNMNNPEPPIFFAEGVKEEIMASDVYYFDYPDTSYVFTSITAIDVRDGSFDSEVYLTGATSNVYVSQDNIYLSYQRRMNYEDYAKDFAERVALLILPSDEDEKVEEILDSGEEYYVMLDKIGEVVEDYSESLMGNEKAEFDKKLMDLTEEFQIYAQKKMERTIVHKISVDKGEIEYLAVGEVPGRVLNQFSMDEHDGYFRVATTTGNRWGGSSMNHIYVLNEDLKIVGSVEDLAKGESIYSVRFMGERAYLVTFKKIDPLFVVDLSEPSSPEVLGYLKITGYSDYLHPYDENHVIGIGKETRGGAEQFSWYQGVKISLFDVSDVGNPVEKAKYEIGDRGTDSDALRDHKAFLFDKERELLVIPIRLHEVDENSYVGRDIDSAYGTFKWQGAYVLNINLDGISLRGKVSHDNQSYEDSKYYYGNYRTAVKRSLYMDDVLYTVSESKVMANTIDDLRKICRVSWSSDREPVYRVAGGDVGVAEVDAVVE